MKLKRNREDLEANIKIILWVVAPRDLEDHGYKDNISHSIKDNYQT